MARARHALGSVALGLALATWAGSAGADQDEVVLLPTVIPVAASPNQLPELRRPDAEDASTLARWARQLDAVVTEAVQDLGLRLDVSDRAAPSARTLTDDALVARAASSWVISPRLALEGDKLRLHIIAVAPGSRVLLVRTQEVAPREVAVRALVMTRDVVQAGRGADDPKADPGATLAPAPAEKLVMPARSAGRAVLALNSAAFGGYVGLSLQKASGSSDDRLTYPLIALGAGVGLGASMIVADEWDVGLGDAWFLSAGAWWPLSSGFLLADGYAVDPPDDRFVYGLVGAGAGMTLAATALTFRGMGEGGATLTHSGGAFGMALGGMAQLAFEGRTDKTPTRGMGYGAGGGVLLAGAIATQVSASSYRVLLIDLGVVLGGLAGAAAASPLVFGDEQTEGKDRAWVGSVTAGFVAGGVVAYFMTEPGERSASDDPNLRVVPYGGVVGESVARDGRREPVYGGGVQGLW
ncbi:MAG: hypothetical protein IT375_34100 [Polyangiaceae bacterium]|nr:hypothetical protein [Polyangiaceae bacterium]